MDVRSVTPPPRLGPQGVPLSAEEDALITASQTNPANPLKVTLVGKKGNWDIFSYHLANGSGGSTLFYTTVRNNDIYNNPVWYKYSTLEDAKGSKTAVAAATNWALGGIEDSRAAFSDIGRAAGSAAASSVKKTGWFGMGGRRKTRRGRKNRKSKSQSRKSRRS
jgi:hypothetical protein